jgi:protoporphyrinogen/coproporphyrinogen III oxidase
MEKKHILILGAGVSGLSAAWELSKNPQFKCTILEKDSQVGGKMGSQEMEDFIIEKGPRVYKTSRNDEFLKVVRELGFYESLIPSSKGANVRYLYVNGKLQKMPTGLFSLLSSSLCRPLLFALLKERKVVANPKDETVWDFACRRFNQHVAERFFDPLLLGIYAGDIKKLSTESCFSILKKWEKENGSIFKGAFSSFGKKKNKPSFEGSLFSFKGGSSAFTTKWASKMPFPIHYNEEVTSLKKEGDKWVVKSLNNTWKGDEVVFAMPSYAAAKILKQEAPKSAKLLDAIPYEDLTTIQLGWKGDVLPINAFGYLVPTVENEPVLGVLFDSKMFTQKDTLITLMTRGTNRSNEELMEIANRVRVDHLKIEKEPDHFSYNKVVWAIPQYHLGHRDKVRDLLKSVKEEARNIHLVGNYLEGSSVNDCIKNARERVQDVLY